MDEWQTLTKTGVELFLAAVVLSMGAILGITSNQLGREQQRQADAVAVAKELREFNKYDNTELWAQDVITAILEYRGRPEIWVDTTAGSATNFSIRYTSSTPREEYATNMVTSNFVASRKYIATQVKDANGSIVRLEMRLP